MALNLKIYDNPTEKTKSFSAFDGVDLVSPFDTISDKHSPCMINMYRDYSDGSVLRTRPAFKKIADIRESVFDDNPVPYVNYSKVIYNTIYYRSGAHLLSAKKDGAPNFILNNGEKDIFENNNSSSKQCVEYNNKLYFYETDDVYIFDGATVTKWGDTISKYAEIFKVGGEYTVLTLPYINGTSGDRYLLSDYTLSDANKAFAYVAEKGTLTDTEKNKYNLDGDNDVTIADANVIFQIVSGRYRGQTVKTLSLMDLPIELAPMVNINTDSGGAGTEYERFNLLSPYFIVQYIFDSTKSEYALPLPTASAIGYQKEGLNQYVPINSPTLGKVSLTGAVNGDKFRVLCKLCNEDIIYNSAILRSMKIFEIFDNRVFAAGAEIATGYQNRVMHSGIDNMLYFPDNAYYEDIMGSGKITALLPVKTQLAVIKEDIVGDNAIYMHTPQDTDNELAPRIYPSIYGMFDCGCINCHCYCQFGGESLFLSKSGLMAFTSSDVTNEKSIQSRSTALGIRNIGDNAMIFPTDDYLYVYFDDGTASQKHIFVAGERIMSHNAVSNKYEYEWFDWIRNSASDEAHFFFTEGLKDKNGMLIIGVYIESIAFSTLSRNYIYEMDKTSDKDDVYSVPIVIGGTTFGTEQWMDICSYIATPFCSFGFPQYTKNFIRHACAANIQTTGDVLNVYSNTDITGFVSPIYNLTMGWTIAPNPYQSVLVVTNGVHQTLRPSERGWRYASLVFFTKKGITKFYDVTITAAVKKAVNNIY